MPSAEKAILDPFSELTIPEALLVAVCGMVVVFLMLVVLALVIMVISKLVNTVGGKAEAPKAAPKAAPAPAPAKPDPCMIAVITSVKKVILCHPPFNPA